MHRIRCTVFRSSLCVMLAVMALITSVGQPSPAREKPNIILIMADDVSWEAFGCYGAEDYQTPRLDALASAGIRFDHCYSTPICTTSRVMLMTGKYNFRNYTHFGYLNPQEKTFGQLMQQAGYQTAIAGKWQLNGLYNTLPGHDDNMRPVKEGFDEFLLWQLTTQKTPGGRGGERFWSPPLEHNGRFITKEENKDQYGPDLFCDFICDFMERHQEEPFFVYYPMCLVHNPFVPTPDTIGDRSRGHDSNKANKGAQKENFVAMVQYMDKIVGRIVDKVERLGVLDDTIILFTADNGTNVAITSRWNGQDIRGGKGSMTDMGTHVPLIAYWKGHTPQGAASNDLIDFTDFYPTLAAAAAISLAEDDPIDGRSFLPQLNGQKGQPRDWVLCHYQPYWNQRSGQFVRNERFKLYRDGRYFQVPIDLQESNNLLPGMAGDSGEVARAELASILQRCPPAPPEKGSRETEVRPIFPDWRPLADPND